MIKRRSLIFAHANVAPKLGARRAWRDLAWCNFDLHGRLLNKNPHKSNIVQIAFGLNNDEIHTMVISISYRSGDSRGRQFAFRVKAEKEDRIMVNKTPLRCGAARAAAAYWRTVDAKYYDNISRNCGAEITDCGYANHFGTLRFIHFLWNLAIIRLP